MGGELITGDAGEVQRSMGRARLLLMAMLLLTAVPAVAGPVILVLGDSLSAGYGIDPDEGWVALLARRLDGWQVVNASISGETTRGARTRLPALLERQAPALVIVELGGNDGLRGIALTEMRANLEALVTTARESGAQVLLVGVRLPPNYGPAYTKAFAAVFEQVATKLHVPLVPRLLEGVGGHPELMQEDGIHPRQEVQERLLENVWPVLEGLVGSSQLSVSSDQ